MAHALTVKGQVTIPKAVREHLRLGPGDAVEFTIRADGVVVVSPAEAPEEEWAKLRRLWHGPPTDEYIVEMRGPPDEDDFDKAPPEPVEP